MQYEIKRAATMKAPAKVNQQVVGAVGNLRILKGAANKNPDRGSFLLNTNFATPFSTFDVIFEAQTEVDGKPVTITSPAMSVEIVPGYQITLARTEIEIAPGAKVQIPGKVRREPTFEGGLIKIQPEDLPDNVKCAPVEVPENQKDFLLSCEAEPNAKPGAFEIRLASVAPETGRKAKADYKIPDLTAKLQVGKTKMATNEH
jgi:hypothetical protein